LDCGVWRFYLRGEKGDNSSKIEENSPNLSTLGGSSKT